VKGMKMTVFWDVATCSLVAVYRRFRGACISHHCRPDNGGSMHIRPHVAPSQKTAIFSLQSVYTFGSSKFKNLSTLTYSLYYPLQKPESSDTNVCATECVMYGEMQPRGNK
jgi:hypothetical protein